MKGTQLGEFEELVLLLVGALFPEAYGLSIRIEIEDKMGRVVSLGAIHSALSRLEEKGFIDSKLASETHERGGRRKRLFWITASGKKALETSRELRNALWDRIPALAWSGLGHD